MKFITGFFFVILLITRCSTREPSTEIAILWRDEQAVAISIPTHLTGKIETATIADSITVRLSETSPGIFGSYKAESDVIIFQPLVPFSRGLEYFLYKQDDLIGSIQIPLPDAADAPQVTGVFPSRDVLPENVLKIYITFSKSMRQGAALDNIVLVTDQMDTVKSPFLDLKPELWNEDGTILTVWFDPGRVKRDLQPNQLLGAPLEKGRQYTLIIADAYKDTRGATLQSVFSKVFTVTDRDSLSPDPGSWEIMVPAPGTQDPLKINIGEPLDYLLLKSAIAVANEQGDELRGMFQIREEETELIFLPDDAWWRATYFLTVESRLEDLAGNNLERPFDRDISSSNAKQGSEKIYRRSFVIE